MSQQQHFWDQKISQSALNQQQTQQQGQNTESLLQQSVGVNQQSQWECYPPNMQDYVRAIQHYLQNQQQSDAQHVLQYNLAAGLQQQAEHAQQQSRDQYFYSQSGIQHNESAEQIFQAQQRDQTIQQLKLLQDAMAQHMNNTPNNQQLQLNEFQTDMHSRSQQNSTANVGYGMQSFNDINASQEERARALNHNADAQQAQRLQAMQIATGLRAAMPGSNDNVGQESLVSQQLVQLLSALQANQSTEQITQLVEQIMPSKAATDHATGQQQVQPPGVYASNSQADQANQQQLAHALLSMQLGHTSNVDSERQSGLQRPVGSQDRPQSPSKVGETLQQPQPDQFQVNSSVGATNFQDLHSGNGISGVKLQSNRGIHLQQAMDNSVTTSASAVNPGAGVQGALESVQQPIQGEMYVETPQPTLELDLQNVAVSGASESPSVGAAPGSAGTVGHQSNGGNNSNRQIYLGVEDGSIQQNAHFRSKSQVTISEHGVDTTALGGGALDGEVSVLQTHDTDNVGTSDVGVSSSQWGGYGSGMQLSMQSDGQGGVQQPGDGLVEGGVATTSGNVVTSNATPYAPGDQQLSVQMGNRAVGQLFENRPLKSSVLDLVEQDIQSRDNTQGGDASGGVLSSNPAQLLDHEAYNQQEQAYSSQQYDQLLRQVAGDDGKAANSDVYSEQVGAAAVQQALQQQYNQSQQSIQTGEVLRGLAMGSDVNSGHVLGLASDSVTTGTMAYTNSTNNTQGVQLSHEAAAAALSQVISAQGNNDQSAQMARVYQGGEHVVQHVFNAEGNAGQYSGTDQTSSGMGAQEKALYQQHLQKQYQTMEQVKKMQQILSGQEISQTLQFVAEQTAAHQSINLQQNVQPTNQDYGHHDQAYQQVQLAYQQQSDTQNQYRQQIPHRQMQDASGINLAQQVNSAVNQQFTQVDASTTQHNQQAYGDVHQQRAAAQNFQTKELNAARLQHMSNQHGNNSALSNAAQYRDMSGLQRQHGTFQHNDSVSQLAQQLGSYQQLEHAAGVIGLQHKQQTGGEQLQGGMGQALPGQHTQQASNTGTASATGATASASMGAPLSVVTQVSQQSHAGPPQTQHDVGAGKPPTGQQHPGASGQSAYLQMDPTSMLLQQQQQYSGGEVNQQRLVQAQRERQAAEQYLQTNVGNEGGIHNIQQLAKLQASGVNAQQFIDSVCGYVDTNALDANMHANKAKTSLDLSRYPSNDNSKLVQGAAMQRVGAYGVVNDINVQGNNDVTDWLDGAQGTGLAIQTGTDIGLMDVNDCIDGPGTPYDDEFLGRGRDGRQRRQRSGRGYIGQSEVGDEQLSLADKLKRDLRKSTLESDKLEKEVQRQKQLRETERQEFIDAKERLKNSWAADRDDFSRVKEQLKRKNAEHHVTTGRLAQAVRESEGQFRILRDYITSVGHMSPNDVDELITNSQKYNRRGQARNTFAPRPIPRGRRLDNDDSQSDNEVSTSGARGGDGTPRIQSERDTPDAADGSRGETSRMSRLGVKDKLDVGSIGGEGDDPVVDMNAVAQQLQQVVGSGLKGLDSEAITQVAASATVVAAQVLQQSLGKGEAEAAGNGGSEPSAIGGVGVSVSAAGTGEGEDPSSVTPKHVAQQQTPRSTQCGDGDGGDGAGASSGTDVALLAATAAQALGQLAVALSKGAEETGDQSNPEELSEPPTARAATTNVDTLSNPADGQSPHAQAAEDAEAAVGADASGGEEGSSIEAGSKANQQEDCSTAEQAALEDCSTAEQGRSEGDDCVGQVQGTEEQHGDRSGLGQADNSDNGKVQNVEEVQQNSTDSPSGDAIQDS